jgi:hypothetical protein
MATWNLRLTTPPSNDRNRELWLQHAAGLILFEDVRAQGLGAIPESASEPERATATAAVDAAVYGLMQVIDGVTGALGNDEWSVDVDCNVNLRHNGTEVARINLRDGDGMCMGFHQWLNGDFGNPPVVDRDAP